MLAPIRSAKRPPIPTKGSPGLDIWKNVEDAHAPSTLILKQYLTILNSVGIHEYFRNLKEDAGPSETKRHSKSFLKVD